MPYIKVNVDKIKEYQQDVYNIRKKVNMISNSFSNLTYQLDHDIKNSSGIRRKLQNIESTLSDHKTVLQRTNTFLGNTSLKYINAEKTLYAKDKASGDAKYTDIDEIAKTIAKQRNLSSDDVKDAILSGKHSLEEIIGYTNGIVGSGTFASAIEKIKLHQTAQNVTTKVKNKFNFVNINFGDTNRICGAIGAGVSVASLNKARVMNGVAKFGVGTSSALGTPKKNQIAIGVAVGSTVEKKKSSISFSAPFSYIDTKSLITDSVKTGASIYSALKKGLGTFNIKQVGDCIRIYGKRKARTAMKLPQGNKVRVGSDVYYGKGYALWFKNASLADRFKSSFSGFGKDTFFSKTSLISYAAIAVDTFSNLVGNVKNGASKSKIFADATTDIAKGLGSMAVSAAGAKSGAAIGAAIGSIFPGVGTVIGGAVGAVVGGAVAGFAYDYIVDGGIKIGGKSIAGWVSTGIEKAGDWLGDTCSKIGDAVKSKAKSAVKNIQNTVKETAKNVTKTVTNTVKSVGNAVKGAAKSVKKFFKKLF